MATYTRAARKTQVSWDPDAVGGSSYSVIPFRVENFWGYPEKADVIEGDASIGYSWPAQARIGGRYVEFGFSSEIRGGIAAGGPPPEGALLRACGISETGSGTTALKVYQYADGNKHFATDSPAGVVYPVDITMNFDRLNYIAVSCVGDVEYDFSSRKVPMYHFKFRGKLAALGTSLTTIGHSDGVAQTALTVYSPPAACNNETVRIASYAPSAVDYIKVKINNKIDDRPDIGSTGGYGTPYIGENAPELEMVFETDLLTTPGSDPVADFLAGTERAVTWIHSSATSWAAGYKLSCTFNGFYKAMPELVKVGSRVCWKAVMQQAPTSAAFAANWSLT